VLPTAPLRLRLERRTPWRPALVPRRTRSKSHLRCAQGTPAPSIAPRAVTTTPNGSCRLYIPPALRVVETSLAVSPATSAMSAPRGPPSGFQSLAVALSFPSPHLCPLSSLHRSSVHSGVHASAVFLPSTARHPCHRVLCAQSAHHDDARQEWLPDTCSAYPAGRSSLANPNWRAAMVEEHDALLKNHSWDLVLRLVWANVSTSSRQMGLLSSIRHVGSFAASLSALAWISRRLSVLW